MTVELLAPCNRRVARRITAVITAVEADGRETVEFLSLFLILIVV